MFTPSNINIDMNQPWIRGRFGCIYNYKYSQPFEEILKRYQSGEFLGKHDDVIIDTLEKENKYKGILQTRPFYTKYIEHCGGIFDYLVRNKDVKIYKDSDENIIIEWPGKFFRKYLKTSEYAQFLYKNDIQKYFKTT